MLLALKNCMNIYPCPQELYNSKHMDMNPLQGGTVPHIKYLVYLSNHIATGYKSPTVCMPLYLILDLSPGPPQLSFWGTLSRSTWQTVGRHGLGQKVIIIVWLVMLVGSIKTECSKYSLC